MVQLRDVDVTALSLAAFQPLVGDERYTHLELAAETSRGLLAGRTAWNVNSTAAGGGVAEMLAVLVGYIKGAGIDARWVVIDADPAFFMITKRLHNRLHGMAGDTGALGASEAAHYAQVTAANADALADRVRPGDIVILHDPQTAGMAPRLQEHGAKVVWRSHIGSDAGNASTEEAWAFLRPYMASCDAFVFTRQAYVPPWLPADQVWIIPPSIDPFSAKNQELPPKDLPFFLSRMGLISGPAGPATFTRRDGTRAEVTRRATVVAEGGPLSTGGNLVVQVSRWDHLKDMGGVMVGFADRVVRRVDAHLALVGPSVEGVADDPEGSEVLHECIAGWEALPLEARRRIRLVTLPMDDLEENAVMVNAVQRSATIIVQKSLMEGFGLTVAEGMWKRKAVIASGVGGIVDQVVPGTGVLLDDPTDLDAYGDALVALLDQPEEIATLGQRAHDHVLSQFVGDRHLLQHAALIQRLVGP